MSLPSLTELEDLAKDLNNVAAFLQVALTRNIDHSTLLLSAKKNGVKFLTELFEDEGLEVIFGLCPDGSILLVTIADDEDTDLECWKTGSFPSVRAFSQFLHGEMEGFESLHKILPAQVREDLTRAIDKFTLARNLEPGHA
jgi:hypothetical protein